VSVSYDDYDYYEYRDSQTIHQETDRYGHGGDACARVVLQNVPVRVDGTAQGYPAEGMPQMQVEELAIMPLKVHVTMECAECGRKIPLKGKTFTRTSRRHGSTSGIYLPDVYIVGEPDDMYDESSSMSIRRGMKYFGPSGDFPDDEDGLVCSLDCAIKRAARVMKKLTPEKVEKES
jgi:hypothetical protein